MKRKHILKIIGASIVVIFILGIGTLSQKNTINTKNITIAWREYEDTEDTGYLYLLTDKITNKNFYIASERAISGDDFMDNRYTFSLLYMDEIWNPRLCIKMPSVIDTKGNVLMLDYKLDNNDLKKRLIKYDAQSKKIYFVDLLQMDILGKIYISKDDAYFFTKEGNEVVRNSLRIDNNSLETVEVPLEENDKKIKLSLDNETGIVYFQTTSDNLTTMSYSYNYERNSLDVVKGVPNRSTTKLIKEKKLQNGSITYWDILNPYNVGMVLDEGMAPIFKQDARIYSYIIGGF